MFRRFDIKTELALALLPTTIIILVLMLLEAFSKQQMLFSSLASSAFLIYLDPKHPTNRVRTLTIAQMSAAFIGFVMYILVGPGYLSAAISMIVSIIVMIITGAMHPPAVSSALIFAFEYTRVNTLLMFFMAVVLLVLLIGMQRLSIWIIRRGEKQSVKQKQGQQNDNNNAKGI